MVKFQERAKERTLKKCLASYMCFGTVIIEKNQKRSKPEQSWRPCIKKEKK
jgi:hypothetical protein